MLEKLVNVEVLLRRLDQFPPLAQHLCDGALHVYVMVPEQIELSTKVLLCKFTSLNILLFIL